MPQIKLPVSEQFEHVILSDAQFTVAMEGYHVFGATVGRGHQQILDVSRYQSLTITASSSLGLSELGMVLVLLFDENGRLTSGINPQSDPAVVDQYGRTLISPGTITIGESRANRIDTSGAVGAVVVFAQGQAGAELQVKVLGERNNKQLEAIRETQASALLASGEVSVSLAGKHYFGKTSGRDHQELLDVSSYDHLVVTADITGVSSDQKMDVLLYDKAGFIPAGNYEYDDPEFIESVGPFQASNGTRHIYRVNVSGAQGAVVRFPDLPDGATVSARITGAQGDPPIEKFEEVTLVHADLFDESGDAKLRVFNWGAKGKYKRILFYATSSFQVPIEISCLESEGGVAKMIKWDGEAFYPPAVGEADYGTVTIPAVPGLSSGGRTFAKYPIHHAMRLLQDGVYSLQVRVKAEAVSDATDTNGKPYELKLTVLGVR